MNTVYTPNTASIWALFKHYMYAGFTSWGSRCTRREYWLGGCLGSIVFISLMLVILLLLLTAIGCSAELVFKAIYDNDIARSSIFNVALGDYIETATQSICVLICIGCSIAHFGNSVRRLHDIGYSGWWELIFRVIINSSLAGAVYSDYHRIGGGEMAGCGFVLIAVAVIFIQLILQCSDSQKGENKWGISPKFENQGNNFDEANTSLSSKR